MSSGGELLSEWGPECLVWQSGNLGIETFYTVPPKHNRAVNTKKKKWECPDPKQNHIEGKKGKEKGRKGEKKIKM